MEIGTVRLVNIEDEMRGAYLDYAMSVITARALPDVRDGLKPVQRRILYAMDELSLRHTAAYKKSARIVGEVLGKYHPHGDAPVYETMVRLAQDFSMRYPLIDGQGNFGSVDGDPPAAMRYTEARMAAIAEELLADIDKNTVVFVPNFDGSLKEPTVMPAKLPNLLINGSSGIAVGMATNIPPHNLNEVVDATIYVVDHFGRCLDAGVPFEVMWARVLNVPVEADVLAASLGKLKVDMRTRVSAEAAKLAKRPADEHRAQALLNIVDEMVDIPPDDLMGMIKGPDFPTAGIILGEDGIKSAYTTGHGRVTIRAKAHVEDMRGNRSQIVVTQLPFQVNKASLIEKMAELVRDRRVEGISELRDESDRQGMRIVVELKREAQPKQILNQLFKYTAMQSTFSINLLALVDGQPRVLTLKMMLLQYLNFRREVITGRTEHDLDKARHRAHILEGLKIALDHLDEVIATIRKSRDAEAARAALMKNFKLTEVQAQAILDMQLRRLAALERKKILDELAETLRLIAHLQDLLAHPGKILFLVKDELSELKAKYGDERRTKIVTEEASDFSEEDLIPDQEIFVAISGKGYIRRIAADSFRLQRRGKGIAGTVAKEDEAPQILANASTLDQLLFFTNKGRAAQTKAHELPDVGRQARGLPVSNFLTVQSDERIIGILPVRSFDQTTYVLLATRGGEVKRVALGEFVSARAGGIIAMSVPEGDEIVAAILTTGEDHIVLVTQQGQALRFSEGDVRAAGRTAGGVRGIRLAGGDGVVVAEVARDDAEIVTVTRNGFGKRSTLADFPVQGRAGGGVRAMAVGARNGPIAGARIAKEGGEIMIVSSGGLVVRTPVEEIPAMSRTAQGAVIAGLEKGDHIAALFYINGRSETKQGPKVPSPTDISPDAPRKPEPPTGKAGRAKTAAPKPNASKTSGAPADGKKVRKSAVSEKLQQAEAKPTSEKPKGKEKADTAGVANSPGSDKEPSPKTAPSPTKPTSAKKASTTPSVSKQTPPKSQQQAPAPETRRVVYTRSEEPVTPPPARIADSQRQSRQQGATKSGKEVDSAKKNPTLLSSIASTLGEKGAKKKEPSSAATPASPPSRAPKPSTKKAEPSQVSLPLFEDKGSDGPGKDAKKK
ncbi:MAG: DNA gyrase subunit A [Chloroflexi bacterium]|nr:DNA gyrase subunit A [Chloroflexota bacterium]